MLRTTLLALLLTVASSPSTSAGSTAGVPAAPRGSLGLTAEVELRYDDNILQLSDEDIDRLARDPDSSRFKVSTPDDWVTLGSVEGRWDHSFLRRRQTRFDLGVDHYDYRTNDIKDWTDYHLDIRQELSPSRRRLLSLRVGLEYMDDFYLRELTDDDASFEAGDRIRRSARYDQTRFVAELEKEFVESRLWAELGWERARRDFVPEFEERDGVRIDWRAEVRGRPVRGSRLELRLRGAFGDYDARGDLPSTPIPDDDISYDHRGLTAEAEVGWGPSDRRLRLTAEVEVERREYATTNEFDLFRFGRRDLRREYDLRLSRRLGQRFDLSARWRHLSNDASFAGGVEPQDDVSDYRENRFDLGLRARFGTR